MTDACDVVEMSITAVPAVSTLAFNVPTALAATGFGVGIHEATFRVNVRWVTPLGEDTASTS